MVIPALRVDARSNDGMTKSKQKLSQETLVSMMCRNFELLVDKDAKKGKLRLELGHPQEIRKTQEFTGLRRWYEE
jgi:hypothetical protein